MPVCRPGLACRPSSNCSETSSYDARLLREPTALPLSIHLGAVEDVDVDDDDAGGGGGGGGSGAGQDDFLPGDAKHPLL
jgi:hypothetical protein